MYNIISLCIYQSENTTPSICDEDEIYIRELAITYLPLTSNYDMISNFTRDYLLFIWTKGEITQQNNKLGRPLSTVISYLLS